MAATRVLGVIGTLLLALACSDQLKKAGQPAETTPSTPRVVAPPAPPQVPGLPETGARDADGNRVDDVLDERIRSAGTSSAALSERAQLQVVLSAPLEQADLDEFTADGGEVGYVFRHLSYGFTGSIPVGRLAALALRYPGRLHLLAAPSQIVPFLDEATRSGRVRGIWANAFAGSPSGYSGSSNITIAVLDTGVYEQHPDLTGRKQGWQDYTADNFANPHDLEGHGTHVASIAVGSGAAFGVGPGTLKYTQSGNMSSFPKDTFVVSANHTPVYLGSSAKLIASAQTKFNGGGVAELTTMWAADGTSAYGAFGSIVGGSPLALTNQDGGTSGMLYQGGLVQTDPPTIDHFAVANSVSSYPAVGDGFNALRGVAPACKWFGAKVFTDAGTGSSFDIAMALDDVVSRKLTDNIKIVNLSLGVSGSGTDTVIRAVVNNAVGAGVVVVAAAGNDYPLSIGDPGRAAKVITVGASNDLNELTSYTSVGVATPPGVDEDSKPDLLAPGGSAYRSQILAADTGTADGNLAGFGDMVADDYANMQGTSMATPFVSGSIALMIDALQKSGTSWSFSSDAQPLFLKMLLLASATETNTNREHATGSNPTLGRASAPRDRFEGFGMSNPDAAIEAMVQVFVSPLTGSVSNTAPARLEWERRAWGRKLDLVNGATVLLSLAVPSTGDYDLYLYAGTPSVKGVPVLRASSVTAANDSDETINFVSSATETAYLFVKRVSGYGSFSLTGSAVSHCGDGDVDIGELCDPAAADSVVCCTSTCTTVADGTTCSDGDKCTTDSCQSGVCAGAPVVCTATDQCHDAGTCSAATGVCSNPEKNDDSACNDGNQCTQSDSCQAGKCTGGNPVVCTASDQCHKLGTCAPATGVCSNPQQNNGFACDDGDKCSKTDSCQAGKCTGGSPVVCAASDQCHKAGTCAPATGLCSDPQQNNGTGCDDGDKCTKTDSCQAGKCNGSSPVACAASDQCHDAGTCAPATGLCSNPQKSDGSGCSDGNQCTLTDTCQAGACQAGTAVACAASDQCHVAGTCDQATGNCSNPAKADATGCDDQDLCTQLDQCQAGACKGLSPVQCQPSDQCHGIGVCSPATGECSNPAAPDGTTCDDGTCQGGACLDSGAGGGGGAGGETGAAGDVGEAGAASLAGSAGAVAQDGGAGGSAGGAEALPGAGSVGSAGSAGSVVAAAGSAGSGDVGSGSAESQTSSGCGCALPGSAGRGASAALALGALLVLAVRRRR